jgi:DNA primase small subunit
MSEDASVALARFLQFISQRLRRHSKMSINDGSDASPEVMLAYYRRLYPFDAIFRWLNHSHLPTKAFTHREFAFTLQGDVYLRYNSFRTAEELKKQVCSLNPTRFEIGPVYSAMVCSFFQLDWA